MQWRDEGIPVSLFSLPPSEESRAPWWILVYLPSPELSPWPGLCQPHFHKQKVFFFLHSSCVSHSSRSTVVQVQKRWFNHSWKFYKWRFDRGTRQGQPPQQLRTGSGSSNPISHLLGTSHPTTENHGDRLCYREVGWPSQGQIIWWKKLVISTHSLEVCLFLMNGLLTIPVY